MKNHISLVFLSHFVMEVYSAQRSLNPYAGSMIIFMDYAGLNKKLPELHQLKAFMKSTTRFCESHDMYMFSFPILKYFPAD